MDIILENLFENCSHLNQILKVTFSSNAFIASLEKKLKNRRFKDTYWL